MTGTVDWGTLIWLVTVLIGAVTGAIAALVMAYRLLQARDMAIEASDERAKMVEASLARDLAAFQLHCAETYATKSGTTAAVERVENAVGDLSKEMTMAFDRLSQRIDRVLEAQSSQSPPPSRRSRNPQ